MPLSALSSTAAFALEVAREAADLVMDIFPQSRASKDIRHKGPSDLVTRADHEAERLITDRIRKRFPDHGLLAEEGTASGGGDVRWIIDPVDGTTNFAHGVPCFAISIAMEEHGQVQCGVVAVPPLREYFVAESGRGAFLVADGDALVRLSPSATVQLSEAVVATGLPPEPMRSGHVPTIPVLSLRALTVRVMGAAALHLAYIAAGRLDAFWEPNLNSWDVAAGILLVEEAGGRVTDWKGRPLQELGGQLLASNGPLHPAMVEVLAPAG